MALKIRLSGNSGATTQPELSLELFFVIYFLIKHWGSASECQFSLEISFILISNVKRPLFLIWKITKDFFPFWSVVHFIFFRQHFFSPFLELCFVILFEKFQ